MEHDFCWYIANVTENENKDGEVDVIYKVKCYFIVNEENTKFYSKDGNVYYKENYELALKVDCE